MPLHFVFLDVAKVQDNKEKDVKTLEKSWRESGTWENFMHMTIVHPHDDRFNILYSR